MILIKVSIEVTGIIVPCSNLLISPSSSQVTAVCVCPLGHLERVGRKRLPLDHVLKGINDTTIECSSIYLVIVFQ